MADLGVVPCEQCGEPLKVTAQTMGTVDGRKIWLRVHVDPCECGWETDPPTWPPDPAS